MEIRHLQKDPNGDKRNSAPQQQRRQEARLARFGLAFDSDSSLDHPVGARKSPRAGTLIDSL
jgi:hypothetical protein